MGVREYEERELAAIPWRPPDAPSPAPTPKHVPSIAEERAAAEKRNSEPLHPTCVVRDLKS